MVDLRTPRSWACVFTSDAPQKKRKRWIDGKLKLDSGSLKLLEDVGTQGLGSLKMTNSQASTQLLEGEEFRVGRYTVQVGHEISPASIRDQHQLPPSDGSHESGRPAGVKNDHPGQSEEVSKLLAPSTASDQAGDHVTSVQAHPPQGGRRAFIAPARVVPAKFKPPGRARTTGGVRTGTGPRAQSGGGRGGLGLGSFRTPGSTQGMGNGEAQGISHRDSVYLALSEGGKQGIVPSPMLSPAPSGVLVKSLNTRRPGGFLSSAEGGTHEGSSIPAFLGPRGQGSQPQRHTSMTLERTARENPPAPAWATLGSTKTRAGGTVAPGPKIRLRKKLSHGLGPAPAPGPRDITGDVFAPPPRKGGPAAPLPFRLIFCDPGAYHETGQSGGGGLTQQPEQPPQHQGPFGQGQGQGHGKEGCQMS
ncbi:unnamed protein product, partial [Discosporangium mesarthrocarpum]